MSKFVFNQVLGLSSPIAFKCNPLAAIGTAIAGIGTLGNIFGQASANAGNERIARENREWQSEENRKSEQWQEKMWNANNVYNTPSAMKHRMLEAGINPFISSGGIGANSSQLASSPAKQSAPNQPNLVAPQFGNVGQTLLQAAGVSANISNQNANTAFKALEWYDKALKSGMDKDKAYDTFKSLMKTSGHNDEFISNLSESINQDFLSSKIDNDYKALEYFLKTKYGDKESSVKLAKIREEINGIKSQIKLNNDLSSKAAQEAALALARTTTDNETREFTKRILEAEAQMYESNPTANSFLGSDNLIVKFLNTLVYYLDKLPIIGSGSIGKTTSTTHVVK